MRQITHLEQLFHHESKSSQWVTKLGLAGTKEKYFAKDIPHRNHNLNWTEEVFTFDYKIQYTNPITYKLKDLNNEEIESSFYEPELLKEKQDIFGKIRRKNKPW